MKKIYENSAEYREVPQMTRSEYIAEYHDITTYFHEEKKWIKKVFPAFLVIAVGYVIYLILSGSGLVPEIPLMPLLNAEDKKAYIIFCFWIKYIPTFPLASVIIRKRQIRKKENERLKDLEDRKNLCIEIGTYNAEE